MVLGLVLSTILLPDIFFVEKTKAASLTQQERRGKQIYFKGSSPSDQPIKAEVGDASMETDGTTLPCSSCHGYNGQGRSEGGINPSNIRWEHLTRPYDITHPDGRKHSGYSEETVKRAIMEGIDPAGNRLATAMPRYKMSKGDMADLVSYIKRLGKDFDPGLTETSIKIGAILPEIGPLAEMGRDIKAVITGYFEDINAHGGIYSRRLQVRFAESADIKTETMANAGRLIIDEEVFSIVGPFAGGVDKEMAELMQRERVPVLGSSSLFSQASLSLNRYIFYLFSGLKDQIRVLAKFASQRLKIQDPRIAIVYPEAEIFIEVAGAIEEQGKRYGWNLVAKVSYPLGRFEVERLIRRLYQEGADTIFFFGSGGEGVSMMKEAERIEWAPNFFLSGPLTGKEILDAPLSFKHKIFLAYPTLPPGQASEGAMEYRSFLKRHNLSERHPAVQLSAYCAVKILVEGLKLVGKDLSREKLVTALEGFYNFDTGLTPLITYGPNRRIGALGAYIVGIDPERKEFISVSGWLTPD